MVSSTGSQIEVDALLAAHGLRRTSVARAVLAHLLAHPDTSFTHAQLQIAVQGSAKTDFDRGTLYRLVDRLTQVGLSSCRIDARGIRRYQAAPVDPGAPPYFECQSCHRDRSLTGGFESGAQALQQAARATLQALRAAGCRDLSLDVAVRGVSADCAGKAGPLSI